MIDKKLFCPNPLNIKFWILLITVTIILYFIQTAPCIQIAWIIGFQMFCWIFTIWTGVFNND